MSARGDGTGTVAAVPGARGGSHHLSIGGGAGEWEGDPLAAVDEAAAAEAEAKRADALEAAKRAALEGDWQPARDLVDVVKAEAQAAEAGQLPGLIRGAGDVAELAKLIPEDRAAPMVVPVVLSTSGPAPPPGSGSREARRPGGSPRGGWRC